MGDNVSKVCDAEEAAKIVEQYSNYAEQILVYLNTETTQPVLSKCNPEGHIQWMNILEDESCRNKSISTYSKDMESGVFGSTSDLSSIPDTYREDIIEKYSKDSHEALLDEVEKLTEWNLQLSQDKIELQKDNGLQKEANEKLDDQMYKWANKCNILHIDREKLKEDNCQKDLVISKLKEDHILGTQALALRYGQEIKAIAGTVIESGKKIVIDAENLYKEKIENDREIYDDLHSKYSRVKLDLAETEAKLKDVKVNAVKKQRYIMHLQREQIKEKNNLKSAIRRIKRKFYNESNAMQSDLQALQSENNGLTNSADINKNLLEHLDYTTLKLCESEKGNKLMYRELVDIWEKMVETEKQLSFLKHCSKKQPEDNIENSTQHDREVVILRKEIEKLKNSVKGKEKASKEAIKWKKEAISELEDINKMYSKQIQEQ